MSSLWQSVRTLRDETIKEARARSLIGACNHTKGWIGSFGILCLGSDLPHVLLSQESDPVSRERRDTRVPAKKNRTLDSTVEEDDHNVSRSRSNSASPPVSASPRQELKMRVRQISQGVEDLQWTNAQAQEAAYDVDIELPDATPTNDKTPEAQAVGASLNPGGVLAGGITPESFSATPESREPYLEPPLPAPEATTSLTPAGFNPSSAKTFPADYSESGEKEKGLKRKFLERGTSQGPQEAAQAASEPLKRARDDADKDDNPRETKRPSPPPSPKVTEAKTVSLVLPDLFSGI